MLNRRSNIVLAAGVTLAITALTAGSASAAGHSPAAKSMGNQTMSAPAMVKGIKIPGNTNVNGIKIPGKVTGITGFKIPGKVITVPPKGIVITGIVKPPIKGIIVTGIVKPPKVVGVWIPPVTGVVVTPPSIVEVPVPHRRYSWYTGGSVAAASPVMSTAVTKAEAPCNCLTKEYLQDGSVLFKDLCTKEAAVLTVEEMKANQQGANAQNQ